MKRADASGAAFAVIFGEEEVANGTAGVKRCAAPARKGKRTFSRPYRSKA
jgi:histidyl-tRNA synthetase